jgi:choloylglycine hydrolase
VVIKTQDGKHILARTMDYSHELDTCPVFVPRGYEWANEAENTVIRNRYGLIGAGIILDEQHVFVMDGVNEAGLAVAELYLPGETHYQEENVPGKMNVAPHELILWLLGNCKTLEDVGEAVKQVNIRNLPVQLLGFTTPLHWIITDVHGHCGVIEPVEANLEVIDNPVGVMTNTPQLAWHITNLRNYLHVRPKQYEPQEWGTYTAMPFSQGTGTAGLPGGFSPTDRFVRAAFFREHIAPAADETQGISNVYHILNTVRIPKGIVVTNLDTADYTQYVGSMCNESKTYYYTSYNNHQITKLVLDERLLAQTKPQAFHYGENEESFLTLNRKR